MSFENIKTEEGVEDRLKDIEVKTLISKAVAEIAELGRKEITEDDIIELIRKTFSPQFKYASEGIENARLVLDNTLASKGVTFETSTALANAAMPKDEATAKLMLDAKPYTDPWTAELEASLSGTSEVVKEWEKQTDKPLPPQN